MLALHRHPNAEQDLLKIINAYQKATGAARMSLKGALARILVVLEQMEEDENFQSHLLIHTSDIVNGLNFQKWIAQYKLGNDLWRIKLWSGPELVRYRIIYAYEKPSSPIQAKFHVLAIVDRNNFNYEDPSVNPLSARIINDYHSL